MLRRTDDTSNHVAAMDGNDLELSYRINAHSAAQPDLIMRLVVSQSQSLARKRRHLKRILYPTGQIAGEKPTKALYQNQHIAVLATILPSESWTLTKT